MNRGVTRNLIVAGVALALLYGAVEVTLRAARLPGVVQAVRLATAVPSQTPLLFPARDISAAPVPGVWEESAAGLADTINWLGDRLTLAEFADATNTNALVVISDGLLVGEWYRSGFGPETAFPSYSVAKSVVSLLVGQEIAAGRLRETDRLVDLVPWLAGDDRYGDITIRHLLDMQSGIDVSEVYTNPLSPVARMYATSDLDRFLQRNQEFWSAPGSAFDYRSVDTALLGVVAEEVTGTRLADLVTERLWHPMGAEFDATWSLDRPEGREKAFCCLNARARDFARIGAMVLDDGVVGNRQVVPKEWIDRITGQAVDIGAGWAYSAQWWMPPSGELVASGIHGQLIVVDHRERTVIVRLADDDLDRDTAAILAALDTLVEG